MATALAHLTTILPRTPDTVRYSGIDFPRGAVSEIYGPASSGRTSLLYGLLAEVASVPEEHCVLIDTDDIFDSASASARGVELDRLLWIRCGHNAGHALRAADLVVQSGGFGLVALDLGDTQLEIARRIPLSSWYRLRRAVENTRTMFVVLSQEPCARPCASLAIEMRRGEIHWSGDRPPGRRLERVACEMTRTKPMASGSDLILGGSRPSRRLEACSIR